MANKKVSMILIYIPTVFISVLLLMQQPTQGFTVGYVTNTELSKSTFGKPITNITLNLLDSDTNTITITLYGDLRSQLIINKLYQIDWKMGLFSFGIADLVEIHDLSNLIN